MLPCRRSLVGGSPPLARGVPRPARARRRRPRITPAGAGSTVALMTATSVFTDHPRWRGEHTGWVSLALAAGGSPPLARGARTDPRELAREVGITPAGAGRTMTSTAPGVGVRDHPRWRGEHLTDRTIQDRVEGSPRWRGEHADAAWEAAKRDGSPPLARGAQRHAGAVRRGAGITPAGAGSTGRGAPTPRSRPDHPRWRGEHRVM